MSYTVYDELARVTKEDWDYLMRRLAYQPPAYSFKNRGVTMPPEYGQEACANMAQQCTTEEVYVNGKYLNRIDVAAAQQKFAERDAAAERRKAEEQKKKDEEAERQATIALHAEKHMTRRSMYGSSWLLLDPKRVRAALAYAEKNDNMVSLGEDGAIGHDRPGDRLDALDRRVGTYTFCPKATR